ncbi:MAG: hypothetical protein AAF399_16660 [Bacteroidota bacterium]
MGEKDQAELRKDWHGVEIYWSYFSPEKSKTLLQEAGFRILWEELEQMDNGEAFFHIIVEK